MTLAPETVSSVVALDDAGFFHPLTGAYYDYDEGQYLADQEVANGFTVDGYMTGGGDNPGPVETVTAEQNRAALNSASAQALNAAGLSNTPRGNWTGTDAANYVRAFREIILANPAAFTPETTAIASNFNLHRVDDWSRYDPNKPIQPALILVAITDVLNDAVESFRPVSTIPGSIMRLPGKISDAANGILEAAQKVVSGLGNTAALAPVLLPLAGIAIVYFLSKSAARDATSAFR